MMLHVLLEFEKDRVEQVLAGPPSAKLREQAGNRHVLFVPLSHQVARLILVLETLVEDLLLRLGVAAELALQRLDRHLVASGRLKAGNQLTDLFVLAVQFLEDVHSCSSRAFGLPAYRREATFPASCDAPHNSLIGGLGSRVPAPDR